MLDLMTDEILTRALREDIGTGDITTMSTVEPERRIMGRFVAKEEGILCGTQIAARVFALLDPEVQTRFTVREGERVEKGQVIGTVEGNARSILSGERVALNFLQHLSGIATKTRSLVEQVKGTKAKIADTRKTTPGLRTLEKYAVRIGESYQGQRRHYPGGRSGPSGGASYPEDRGGGGELFSA